MACWPPTTTCTTVRRLSTAEKVHDDFTVVRLTRAGDPATVTLAA